MGGKTTTSTQSVQIPPEVLARYNAVNARAEDVASRPFIPYSNDPNAFVAALTPSQQAGIANINASAGMSQPSYAAGQNMILGGLSTGAPLVQQGLGQGQALTGNALDVGSRFGSQAEQAIGAGMGPVNAEQFSEAGLQKYMSPYMKNVVEAQQALQQQEAEQQRSAMNTQAIMSGAFGGDRGGIAQANLAKQQSLANQATLANLLQSGYTQGLGAFQQQQGVNLAAGQANRAAMQNAANQLSALGQQQYAQSLGAGQNLYNMGLGAGQALYGMGTGAGQAYAGLGGQAEQAALNAGQAQMAAGQIQQQTDQAAKTAMYNQFLQQQGYPYQQAQFLANLAMGTGALSGSTTTTQQPSGWSDRRLKENIKKIGETYDGQDIYRYNLKGEDRTQIGLMAQDVEKHNPEAVGESHGYKTLDYKKATDDAAERGHFEIGGLVPSRMGGAVFEPGDFARGGFADGGDSGDDVATTTPANPNPSPNDQVASLYQSKLGRTGTAEEYKYWSDLMSSRGLSADQIGSAIANTDEGKSYATKQADIQNKAATGEVMATGIKNTPYQETLKYNPAAFAPQNPVTKNASGFYAAGPGSYGSSFANPQATGKGPAPGYNPASTPQATGKGPAMGTGSMTGSTPSAPQATGKGPAPAPAPIPPAVSQRYGSAVGRSTPVGGAPAPSGGAPQASGKGSTPVASFASGGAADLHHRIHKDGGGVAALMQLAAQHAAQYGQMAGGPGTERIKHTLQQPSREAIRDLRSSGAAPRAATLGDNLSQAARTGESIGKLYDMGEKASKYVVGGQDASGKRIPSLRERLSAIGKDQQGPTRPGETITSTGPNASVEDPSNIKLAGGKVDPDDWMSNTNYGGDYEMPVAAGKGPDMVAAHGGRINRFAGGRAAFRSGGLPSGLAPEDGIEIPDDQPGYKLGENLPKGGGGGGGKSGPGPLDIAMTLGKIALMFAKDGGAVRPHKYGGGLLEGVEYSEAPREEKEETRGLEPVRFAARNDTMSDAPLPGLGVVRDAPMPTTGLVPMRRSANMDINPEAPQGVGVEVAELGVSAPSFEHALKRVFKEEGGLNKRDTNGEPSLYGINRKYHPDFFDDPTPEKAAKIYRTQYWDAIKANDMSPELAHVAFDTAVIAGVEKARQLVRASGGDPMKLLELRKQFQDGLIENNPEKYGAYARTWDRRINNLRADITNGVDNIPEPGTTQRNDVREGSVAQARTPGVAGPGLGPMDRKSAPYLNLLERAGGESLPDELKSSAFWRPLLAGVGTMLASNKPRFSQALGEGLVGAVSASGGEEERAQSLAASRASTEKTMSDIVGSSFKTENGITFIKVIKSDGSYDWLPYNEWLAVDPDKRPRVDPRVEAIINQARGATVKPAAPAGAPAAPAGGAKAGDTEEVAPGVRPAIPGVEVTKNEAGIPTVIALSKDQAKTAAKAAFEMAGANAATKARAEAVDYFDPQLKIATSARSQQQVINPLAASFASIPASGSISTSGKAQEFLQPFMATLNNIAAIAGKPNLIQDPSILMNQNEVNKLVNQLQRSDLKDAQLRAVSAFKELADGIPSLSTSPGGQYALMSKLLTANMREIDKDNFFNEWQQAGRGNRGQYADFVRLTSREANREFDRNYTDAFYAAERAAIEKMFRDKAPDPSTGKETPIIAYLTKYGNTLGEEEKKMIRDRYGPNILRYFGVPN